MKRSYLTRYVAPAVIGAFCAPGCSDLHRAATPTPRYTISFWTGNGGFITYRVDSFESGHGNVQFIDPDTGKSVRLYGPIQIEEN